MHQDSWSKLSTCPDVFAFVWIGRCTWNEFMVLKPLTRLRSQIANCLGAQSSRSSFLSILTKIFSCFNARHRLCTFLVALEAGHVTAWQLTANFSHDFWRKPSKIQKWKIPLLKWYVYPQIEGKRVRDLVTGEFFWIALRISSHWKYTLARTVLLCEWR